MKSLWLGLAGVALWVTPSSAQESLPSMLETSFPVHQNAFPMHETRRVP
jgi:hypothetical protein